MKLFNFIKGKSQARTSEMARIAANSGCPFIQKDDTGIIQQLSEFKLFKIGGNQKITNLIVEDSLEMRNILFDFKYVISTGKSHAEFNQTVFFVDSKKLSLPHFIQKPETFFTKLLSYLGFDDIDFENFTEYSERFHLKGEYEQVIRYYFSKEVLSLLSRQNSFSMEAMNYYFIMYQKNKLCPIKEMVPFKNMGLMLYNLFKIQSQESEDMLL